MRYLLLLLLSFPAYAETWFVTASFDDPGGTVNGQFTTEGQTINSWSFLTTSGLHFDNKVQCFPPDNFCTTETVTIFDPAHLYFLHVPSSGTAGLHSFELWLSGPLQTGVKVVNADFVEAYGFNHLGRMVSGSISHAPEPETWAFLAAILTIQGMRWVRSRLTRS